VSKRKTSLIRKDSFSRRKHRDNEIYAAFGKNNTNNIVDFNTQIPQKRPQKPIELIPQSINQEKYILALTDPDTDIVVVSGPAGSGKTYLAMLAAIQAMRKGECEKIILTRPAVSVDEEKHGFLPGDLNSKMEPWVRPLFDILREYYNAKELAYMMDEQTIEIAPLAFCRGRTFKNAWIICDEMQNASPNQCKMIMTRIGEGSKIIITGDTDQTDRTFHENGLLDLKNRITRYNVFGMTACEFDHRDIRRHRIIEHVLKMYQ
jgi:phosphate starvation-inducible protein PhoH and related proteins